MRLSMIVVITSCAPGRRLQPAGDRRPQRAGDRAGEQRQRQVDVDRAGRSNEKPTDDRRHAAEDQLALGADVEQAGAEAEREAEAGERQRRRRGQRLRDRVDRAERAGEQRHEGPCRSVGRPTPVASIVMAPRTSAMTTARIGTSDDLLDVEARRRRRAAAPRSAIGSRAWRCVAHARPPPPWRGRSRRRSPCRPRTRRRSRRGTSPGCGRTAP